MINCCGGCRMQFAAKFKRTSVSEAGSRIEKRYTEIEGTPTLCLKLPNRMKLELDQEDYFLNCKGYYGRIPVVGRDNLVLVPEFYENALKAPVSYLDPFTLMVGDLVLEIEPTFLLGMHRQFLEEVIS